MKASIVTGIYRESGIGHWPCVQHVSYSDSDPDRTSPIYTPALIEKPSHEDPVGDLHPLKITGEKAEWLNFRVSTIRISGGFPHRVSYNGPRHSWQGNTNQPTNEEQLGAYPGVAVLDVGPSSPPPEYTLIGLCIGYPLTFALQDSGYERPNDRAFPVPCDDLIFPATSGPVIPPTISGGDYSKLSFPPACYFWKGLELPYFHLQWQRYADDYVFSTCQSWDLSAGGVRAYDTGAVVNVFDWGSVPIYCYRFDSADPNPPAFTEDVTIEATGFYEYGGLYHPTTGRRLTSR